MEQIFKRKLYDRLLEWKRLSNGSSAMLIEGARRVGKSTLAEQFAKNEYSSYLLIDFSKCSSEIKEIFDDIHDLDWIFNRLQFMYGVQLKNRESLIIFDEIQFAPRARQAIKHLVADGRYDYLETGSLISIHKNVKDILIPSEEDSVTMYPMDYEEFRWAMGDNAYSLMREMYEKRESLGDGINRKLMRDFRLYMLVGGMPQAVNEYLISKDLLKVDMRKREIIRLYESDFRKIDPTGLMGKLFHAIPAQLNKNNSRFMITQVSKNRRVEDILSMLNEMADSFVVNICYHANDPNVGLAMNFDLDKFKMYVGDTGLFVTLAFWDKQFTSNDIYGKLLSDKLSADVGYVYENIVAQMLVASGHNLYYYTFPTDSGKHNYEIDFIIPDGTKIAPIEVKSSGYKSHASIDAFCAKFSHRIGHRYLVYTKDLRVDDKFIYLPAYMVPFI